MTAETEEQKYVEMLQKLIVAKDNLDKREDYLEPVDLSLIAVVGYLQTDRVIREGDLLSPLRVLQEAINDRWQGGKPKLFFESRSVRNRPVLYSHARVRDMLDFCAEMMRQASATEAELGIFIAREAQRRGLRLTPRLALSPRAVQRLDEDHDQDGSPASGYWRRHLRQTWRKPEPLTVAAAKKQVIRCLDVLAQSRLPSKAPS